jgi:thiamine transport system permease protein
VSRFGARRWLLAVLPLAFFAVFFAYPLAAIVLRGLRPDGQWDLSQVGDVVGDTSLRHVAWFTVWQAAVSTLLTLIVGIPAAYCFARLEFRGKRVLWALLIVPFVLPTVVVASAILGVLGPRSPIGVNLSGTIAAILIAHVFFNYAVVVRTVGAFWANLDPSLEDAARVTGASHHLGARSERLRGRCCVPQCSQPRPSCSSSRSRVLALCYCSVVRAIARSRSRSTRRPNVC